MIRLQLAVGLAAILIAALPAMAEDDTLYQRLGGEPGVARIVDSFHAILLADDRVKADFENTNPDRLKSRLRSKICELAKGPCVYHGQAMTAVHSGLNINRAKFNAVAEDMQAAMQRLGVPYWTQNRLIALLAPMQRDIVTR